MVTVNGGFFTVEVLFSGYEQSGIDRENGEAGFDEFMETKTILIG